MVQIELEFAARDRQQPPREAEAGIEVALRIGTEVRQVDLRHAALDPIGARRVQPELACELEPGRAFLKPNLLQYKLPACERQLEPQLAVDARRAQPAVDAVQVEIACVERQAELAVAQRAVALEPPCRAEVDAHAAERQIVRIARELERKRPGRDLAGIDPAGVRVLERDAARVAALGPERRDSGPQPCTKRTALAFGREVDLAQRSRGLRGEPAPWRLRMLQVDTKRATGREARAEFDAAQRLAASARAQHELIDPQARQRQLERQAEVRRQPRGSAALHRQRDAQGTDLEPGDGDAAGKQRQRRPVERHLVRLDALPAIVVRDAREAQRSVERAARARQLELAGAARDRLRRQPLQRCFAPGEPQQGGARQRREHDGAQKLSQQRHQKANPSEK